MPCLEILLYVLPYRHLVCAAFKRASLEEGGGTQWAVAKRHVGTVIGARAIGLVEAEALRAADVGPHLWVQVEVTDEGANIRGQGWRRIVGRDSP